MDDTTPMDNSEDDFEVKYSIDFIVKKPRNREGQGNERTQEEEEEAGFIDFIIKKAIKRKEEEEEALEQKDTTPTDKKQEPSIPFPTESPRTVINLQKAENLLHVYTGPMFTGKTDMLICMFEYYKIIGDLKLLALKPQLDTRYGNAARITSHSQESIDAIACERLFDYFEVAKQNDVIFIDEGQFFPDCYDFCKTMMALGKTLHVAGLNTDYRREPFEPFNKIIATADSVTRLTTNCSLCKKRDAQFTLRTVDSNERVLIGGEDAYKPVCRKCHTTYTLEKSRNKYNNSDDQETNKCVLCKERHVYNTTRENAADGINPLRGDKVCRSCRMLSIARQDHIDALALRNELGMHLDGDDFVRTTTSSSVDVGAFDPTMPGH